MYFGIAGRPTPVAQRGTPTGTEIRSDAPPPSPVAAASTGAATEGASTAPTSPSGAKQPTATSLVKPAVAAPPERPAPPSAPTDAREDDAAHLTVDLTVTAPCWMTATVDGEKRLERLLQPGERQTIEVGRELSFTAGDAAAVKMTINGMEAKSLGRSGEVLTERLNLANVKRFLASP